MVNKRILTLGAYQGARTRSRQATLHARNNWMISKIFHVNPLVTVQKTTKGRVGAQGINRFYFVCTLK